MTIETIVDPPLPGTLPDARLWSAAVSGDTDAFALMVQRYQSLVCAVTFAGVGELGLSQDLAQETFLVAWRRLGSLREPDHLRAWLCGIARTLAANARRRTARRGGEAVALEAIAEPAAPRADIVDDLIARDDARILERALASLPAAYREPLVLYYREERSAPEVAALLDLSHDAVKQRLSRGRALLREEVATIVETALRRTRPTGDFTKAVLAAIAVSSPSTASAAAGVAAATTGGTSASASLGSAALGGPVVGLVTAWVASRLVRAGGRSAQERALLGRHFRQGVGFALGMVGMLLAALALGRAWLTTAPWVLAIGTTGWTVALLGGFAWVHGRMQREIAAVRVATRTTDADVAPDLAHRGLGTPGPHHYASTWRLFGLPLVAFASSGLDVGAGRARPARAWLAIGDLAVSPCLAIGGVALAPIAIGGVTVGFVSLSVAGIAVGGLALGSLAFGWWALGIVAIGWQGAYGAAAIAQDFALGSAARAREANTPVAVEWFQSQWFVGPARVFGALVPWLVLLAIVVSLGLLARRAWRLRRSPAGRC